MKKRTTNYLLLITLAFMMWSGLSFASQPIKGFVRYHENPTKPLPGVKVGLYHENQLIATAITESNGKYTFEDIEYGVYTIKEEQSGILPGGWEMTDYSLISSIVNGSYEPTEIEKLAADLDGDNTVTVNDAYLWMDNWSVGFEPEWVFEERIVNHNGLKTNVPTIGGSSSGDVNGTFVPTGRNTTFIETLYFAKNFTRSFTLEITASQLNEITGMGLVIEYPSEINITNVTSQIKDLDNVKIENNKVIVSWVEDAPFTVKSDEPIVTIHGTVNKLYNGNDIKLVINDKSHFVSSGEVIRPRLNVSYLTNKAGDNLSYCYPNPANNTAKVFFNLPSSAKVNLNIYTLTGQLVKSVINEAMPAGQHSIIMNLTDLQDGVYIYNLETSGEVKNNQSKRLIIVH